MEERISRKQVKVSDRFYESFEQVYDFGFEMFGYFQAERYKQKIREPLDALSLYQSKYEACSKKRTVRNCTFRLQR